MRPGLFVDVSFKIPQTQTRVSIPAAALIYDQRGTRVAVVGEDGRVKMQRIDIYRDLGTSLELKNGLSGGERVVVSPPGDLQDGAEVNIAEKSAERQPRGGGGVCAPPSPRVAGRR